MVVENDRYGVPDAVELIAEFVTHRQTAAQALALAHARDGKHRQQANVYSCRTIGADFVTVDVGQAPVQHHQIEVMSANRVQRLLPAPRDQDAPSISPSIPARKAN